jgi:Trk K+ transport system NAD-binding subunit
MRWDLAVVVTNKETVTSGVGLGVEATTMVVKNRRSRTSLRDRILTEHGNTRAILGATERHHMLADMTGDNVDMAVLAVQQDPLDQIVAKLIASNIDQGHARAVGSAFTNALEVAIKEAILANLEALLNDLGSILIHAVLSRKAQDMINGTSRILGRAMLTNVLNAPVAELAMRDDIDTGKHFVDTRTLGSC